MAVLFPALSPFRRYIPPALPAGPCVSKEARREGDRDACPWFIQVTEWGAQQLRLYARQAQANFISLSLFPSSASP